MFKSETIIKSKYVISGYPAISVNFSCAKRWYYQTYIVAIGSIEHYRCTVSVNGSLSSSKEEYYAMHVEQRHGKAMYRHKRNKYNTNE